MREIPGYANSRTTPRAAAADERATHPPPGHSLSHQSGHPVRVATRRALRPAQRSDLLETVPVHLSRGPAAAGRGRSAVRSTPTTRP